jgi:RNA polymerase sigma-70 factor, ECF subfamily
MVFIAGWKMGAESQLGLTLILGRARAGYERARGELLVLVYEELRRVASGLMRRERAHHTLSPTAVVHYAVIRLLCDAVLDKAADRGYLFASAARAMREVLIDHAQRRAADRRGGGLLRVPLDAVVDYFEEHGLDLVAVHEALDRLAERDERQAQVMTLRYFGGITVAEVAGALGVSVWNPHAGVQPSEKAKPFAADAGTSADDTGGFTPRKGIAPPSPRQPISEPRSDVRARPHKLPMMAQVTIKNIVLLISILILTYGLYVPKSWRRAALVVGPLAVLPFATLMVLILHHPGAMGWLWQGWQLSDTPRISLLLFDAIILLLLALGSTFSGWSGPRRPSAAPTSAPRARSSARPCSSRRSRRREVGIWMSAATSILWGPWPIIC